LNERIANAKTQRSIERSKSKSENVNIIKTAKKLKKVYRELRENYEKMKELKEINKCLKWYIRQSKSELKELQRSRKPENVKQNFGCPERDAKLRRERAKLDAVLREQKSLVERTKFRHQLKCTVLCESVLEANDELERLRDRLKKANKPSIIRWLLLITLAVAASQTILPLAIAISTKSEVSRVMGSFIFWFIDSLDECTCNIFLAEITL